MVTLFSFIGQVDDVRLYPTVSIVASSKCCFVRFAEAAKVTIALHLNNTVFIDRAVIITPVLGDRMPEENEGLVMAMQVQQQHQQGGLAATTGGLSAGLRPGANSVNNDARILAANPNLMNPTPCGQIATQDAALIEANLPPYPLLPGNTQVSKVEEMRR